MEELPKINKKQEATSAITFRHWIEKNPKTYSFAIENKDTRGKGYLNFSEVKQAQLNWGMSIKKGVLMRIVPLVEGMPDYIWCCMPCVVVIKYPKMIAVIDVETFIVEKKRSKRASLLASRAHEISTYTIDL